MDGFKVPHNSASNNAVSPNVREAVWLATILDPNSYPEENRQEVQEDAAHVFAIRAKGGEEWRELRAQLVALFGEPCPPEPLTLAQENYIRRQLGEPEALDLGDGMSPTRYTKILKSLTIPELEAWHTRASYLAWAHRLDTPRRAQYEAKVGLLSAELVSRGVTPPPVCQGPMFAPRASRRSIRAIHNLCTSCVRSDRKHSGSPKEGPHA